MEGKRFCSSESAVRELQISWLRVKESSSVYTTPAASWWWGLDPSTTLQDDLYHQLWLKYDFWFVQQMTEPGSTSAGVQLPGLTPIDHKRLYGRHMYMHTIDTHRHTHTHTHTHTYTHTHLTAAKGVSGKHTHKHTHTYTHTELQQKGAQANTHTHTHTQTHTYTPDCRKRGLRLSGLNDSVNFKAESSADCWEKLVTHLCECVCGDNVLDIFSKIHIQIYTQPKIYIQIYTQHTRTLLSVLKNL